MTHIKNLKNIVKDTRTTLRLLHHLDKLDKEKVEDNPRLEKRILRVRGNIRTIKTEIKRLSA